MQTSRGMYEYIYKMFGSLTFFCYVLSIAVFKRLYEDQKFEFEMLPKISSSKNAKIVKC